MGKYKGIIFLAISMLITLLVTPPVNLFPGGLIIVGLTFVTLLCLNMIIHALLNRPDVR